MPQLVAETIAQSLRERIERGDWADGSRIPPERELAAQFGVARNTIRRAIGLLGDSVAITREVGRGTFVEARTAARSPMSSSGWKGPAPPT